MSQQDVVLLLGSNLGDTKKNIRQAIAMIEEQMGPVLRKSEFLQTKPVEFASNNIFCNIALSIEVGISPVKLLQLVKEIEQKMGRKSDSGLEKNYSDRIIDIDIVTFGEIKFQSKKLTIPHEKHLEEREFSKKLVK